MPNTLNPEQPVTPGDSGDASRETSSEAVSHLGSWSVEANRLRLDRDRLLKQINRLRESIADLGQTRAQRMVDLEYALRKSEEANGLLRDQLKVYRTASPESSAGESKPV